MQRQRKIADHGLYPVNGWVRGVVLTNDTSRLTQRLTYPRKETNKAGRKVRRGHKNKLILRKCARIGRDHPPSASSVIPKWTTTFQVFGICCQFTVITEAILKLQDPDPLLQSPMFILAFFFPCINAPSTGFFYSFVAYPSCQPPFYTLELLQTLYIARTCCTRRVSRCGYHPQLDQGVGEMRQLSIIR